MDLERHIAQQILDFRNRYDAKHRQLIILMSFRDQTDLVMQGSVVHFGLGVYKFDDVQILQVITSDLPLVVMMLPNAG